MTTAISIRAVRKTFPSSFGGRAHAVDDISLEIQPGELYFLLGPSGCGKTTLLRMIAGFIEPTGGAILFNGRDVTADPPNKRNCGMVFQSYALWPHMTVEANVMFGLDVRGVPAEEKRRRAKEALAAVRMEEYATRRPTQLSGGQQQRVALARAIVIRPDVLLLDEPLSNLDARLRIELRGEIRRICKESNITTVYVTHDQKEALSMSDRVAILDHGKVVQVGTPTDLYRSPTTRFVAEFLGETNLIPGTAQQSAQGVTSIRTKIGTLQSNSTVAPGPVVCSVRPEAIKIGVGPIRGVIRDCTYLGETAQLEIGVGETTVRASIMNPREMPRAGKDTWLTIDPSDVAVLPAN